MPTKIAPVLDYCSDDLVERDHGFMPSGLCRYCTVSHEQWEIASIVAGRLLPCEPERVAPWDKTCGVDTLNVDVLTQVLVYPTAKPLSAPVADIFAALLSA